MRAAVKGLNDAQLDTPYREGGWTVRQLVHHIADSHINSYVRFKLALTEDWPTIKPYDEAAWADTRRQPHAADRGVPVRSSAGCTQRWVALLESMTDEEFQRASTIRSEAGRIWPPTWRIYDWHSRHHTAHITCLRARQGW